MHCQMAGKHPKPKLSEFNRTRKGKPTIGQSHMAAAVKGSKWYNNGQQEQRLKEPKEGWKLGRLPRKRGQ